MPRSSGTPPDPNGSPGSQPPANKRRPQRGVSLPLESLPLIPIRDEVYFPHAVFSLLIGREKSVRAIESASARDRRVLLCTQRDVTTEDPDPSDLYSIGTIGHIMQVLRVPDGTVRVVVEGVSRCRVEHFGETDTHMYGDYSVVADVQHRGVEVEALIRAVKSQFDHIVTVGRQIAPEALVNVTSIDDPGRLADTIVPYLQSLSIEMKQEILELFDVRERLERLVYVLKREADIIEVQHVIRGRVEKEMGDSQREMILREQLKAIQQELNDRDEHGSEIEEYRGRISDARMPEHAEERATKELERLQKMPFAAPEGSVIRTYLDWLCSLPWSAVTEDRVDIAQAASALDEDHYGLDKVKERILEHLAVRQLAGAAMKGPILCFVGPPGVGKTSIGRSIARAMQRKFVRISLGGIRDEAEIRGHRRTYIGALPGRIIHGIKQAGSRNPVFMLDEIDKLGVDFRGDPSSALLEALDPEQNGEFSDHYLEVAFDLHDVMFITTANLLDPIPPALRDRMEVIPFSGYIEDEKLAIARQFLCPKQIRENGLKQEHLEIADEAIRCLVREYTREAGVRNLEREISSVCRKVARKVAAGNSDPAVIAASDLKGLLGQPKHRYGAMEVTDQIGAATGLVYTEFGGDIVSVEVCLLKASEGKLVLTGQLGDVMKESAQAALSCVRARASDLGVAPDFHRTIDIHIHVPAGAVPKDGPSAGITIASALASAIANRPVRCDLAMTGEITLRGRVLPVGGVKEKVLAAHRAGIRTVVIPADNLRDLDDVPDNVRAEMSFLPVEHIDDVFQHALRAPATT